MDTEFVKWAATLGVGGAIAAFMFMFYRRDILSIVNSLKEIIASQRELLNVVIATVKETTAAVTANTKTIEALHRRMDLEYPDTGRDQRKLDA